MPVNFTKGSGNSLGMDIMRRINEGGIKKAPVKYIEAVRSKVVDNCGELIEQGARVRPLLADGKQVGWIRGVHAAERSILKHWISDPNDYIESILLLGTTFSKEEVAAMSGLEVRSLTNVVQQMSIYDSSLSAYLPAYSTTYQSENLWYSKGEQLVSWENRAIEMPDGKSMRIMLPSDIARAWASLCTYREQAKKRLEDDYNALFIVRPWAGKHADPIQSDLNRVARGLEVNATGPWEQVVRPERTADVNDGWGHPGDSLEELQRELKGMMEGDKHERVMEAWQKQMEAESEEKRKKVEESRKRRGVDRAGVTEGKVEVLTEQQARARQKALREGKPLHGAVQRREDTELEPTDRQFDKARKYR
jgi:hypothetical protein